MTQREKMSPERRRRWATAVRASMEFPDRGDTGGEVGLVLLVITAVCALLF